MADAVVVPGRMFGPAAGIVLYVSVVAERRNATVHRHSWTEEPPPGLLEDPATEDWVAEQVTPLLDSVGGSPLVIAKSLGTNAAGVVADRSLPAVWLTPPLTVPWIVDALSRATAPALLVGGTGDELWDGAVARRISSHVLEVDDADHGMLVPGPMSRSIEVLGAVVSGVDAFLDSVGWP